MMSYLNMQQTVRGFAEELVIKVHYLPAYSPNLNPIERLWKSTHEKVTYNRYYEDFANFTEAIPPVDEGIVA